MAGWRRRATLLPQTAALFVTDARGVIVKSSLGRMIGRDIAQSGAFQEASAAASNADRLYIGRAAIGPVTDKWQLNLLRGLRDPDGRFAGTIGLIEPIDVLTGGFNLADLGPGSLVGVVGLADGRVRVTLGPVVAPPDISIARSGLFAAMQAAPEGVWTGRVVPQAIERIYGFRRIAPQGLDLAVGIARAQASRWAAKPVRAVILFAGGITALVLLIAATLLFELQMAARRERRLVRDGATLAAANADLQAARSGADAHTAQLAAVLAGMSDGVMMLDAELRVLTWNRQFVELAGIPADAGSRRPSDGAGPAGSGGGG